jgi:hypothetical protein
MKTDNNANQRKSLKGKYGKVGAPPKTFTFPKGKFTMKQLFEANPDSCELTLRNKVAKLVEAGKLVFGKPLKQPDGHVGRPQSTFKRVFGKGAVVATKGRKAHSTAVAPATVAVAPAVVPDVAPAVPVETAPVPVATVEAPAVVPDVAAAGYFNNWETSGAAAPVETAAPVMSEPVVA